MEKRSAAFHCVIDYLCDDILDNVSIVSASETLAHVLTLTALTASPNNVLSHLSRIITNKFQVEGSDSYHQFLGNVLVTLSNRCYLSDVDMLYFALEDEYMDKKRQEHDALAIRIWSLHSILWSNDIPRNDIVTIMDVLLYFSPKLPSKCSRKLCFAWLDGYPHKMTTEERYRRVTMYRRSSFQSPTRRLSRPH